LIILFILLGLLVLVIIWQLLVWFSEIKYKNRQCAAAVRFSRERRKPLLVAGGPYGGRPIRRKLKFAAHVLGDVSIDIDKGAIQGHPNGIVATVTSLPFPDRTFGAAIASHLLEHLYTTTEAKQALKELARVADAVYIAYPTKQSVASWIIPDHRLWVWQEGDTVFLEQRRVANGHREERFVLKNGRED
jgi:hypothetical protein